jgi:hypothetical protein
MRQFIFIPGKSNVGWTWRSSLFIPLLICLSILSGCLSPEMVGFTTPIYSQTPQTATITPTLVILPPVSSPIETVFTPDENPSPVFSPTVTLTVPIKTTLTPWPTNVFTATKGATPTRTPTPTNTPTITYTPTPPPLYLKITHPGPRSKVISPITLEAMISPGRDGFIYIELQGEDNRLLSYKELDYRRNIGARFGINPGVSFEINGVSEFGRLLLYVKDEFGRVSFLSSVDLILLKLGNNELQPSPAYQEPYIIRSPELGESVYGGKLYLKGLARPINGNPLIVELIDEKLNILSKDEIQVPSPTGDLSHTPFVFSINYNVSETTPARLVIRQESNNRIPGNIALSSTRIILNP